MNNISYLKLNCLDTSGYAERTRFNASSSDLTVACALDFTTAGEKFTKKSAGDKYLALTLSTPSIEAARMLYRELVQRQAKTLNLAGNGIYTLSQKKVTQRRVNLWVHDLLVLIHSHYPLQKLVSGGQTGVDIAAAVVGPLINLPTEINFPKGYMQRNESGLDFMQSEEDVLSSIAIMREQLIEDLNTPLKI